MSDIIQLLPDSVANQIAAGEVIQRPASVIKELVENAVDAGAKRIDVIVQDAGRTSIQVIDDGKGMSETDARLAFERHATSKIRKADDLFALHTMGFRGEALPSIVAVSQVELKTRARGDEIGTHLTMAASKFVSQEPCACPVGSNFMVENLFFNVPARRKFLKSNTTELNNIITAFERIALVYPDIAFTFHSNGSELFQLRTGSLRQRIVDIFGKKMNQDLLPVRVETSVCAINGFVGKPESAKKKGAKQYFFVNGRYMRHPYFAKAIQQAYDRLVPVGEQVPFFIYFDVNPKDIDVNIHPTKTEIKFENEQTIFQILLAAVRDTVGQFNALPTIDFDTEGKPDIPVFDPHATAAVPKIDYDPQYNPFTATSQPKAPGGARPAGSSSNVRNWEKLYEGLRGATGHSDGQGTLVPDDEPLNNLDLSPIHYQYKGRYIMTAVKSGLMIIDQHRAHVRILYEQERQRMANRKMASQIILFPETLELTARETVILQQVADELKVMGFELSKAAADALTEPEVSAGSKWNVNAAPEGMEGVNVIQLLHDLLSAAAEKGKSPMDEVADSLALTLARAAAIPYGQVLGNEEMDTMVNALFQCQNVNYAPDGRRILSILAQQDIDRLFS